MKYSEIIKEAIKSSDLSLSQISKRLASYGVNVDKSYLSKLQNNKIPPAGEKINEAIAKLLCIDPLELKAAAYLEKIPNEVLEKILNIKEEVI